MRSVGRCILSMVVGWIMVFLPASAISAQGGNGIEPARGKIAFVSDRDGNREIYVMNVDGSEQTRLTDSPGEDRDPAWSPDGAKIAFASTRKGSTEIYVMNADGTGQTRITNSLEAEASPAWSPDGKKIAFHRRRYTSEGGIIGGWLTGSLPNIWVSNPEGTGETCLAEGDEPDWSPDGTKIAFTSWRNGKSAICVMNADGTGQTNETNNSAWESGPRWSPDGTKIVFSSNRDGNWEIYVMNADGTGQTNLTNNPSWDDSPVWSPGGTKIVFSSNRDGNWEIYAMNADGTGQADLTNNPADDRDPAGSLRWRGPSR